MAMAKVSGGFNSSESDSGWRCKRKGLKLKVEVASWRQKEIEPQRNKTSQWFTWFYRSLRRGGRGRKREGGGMIRWISLGNSSFKLQWKFPWTCNSSCKILLLLLWLFPSSPVNLIILFSFHGVIHVCLVLQSANKFTECDLWRSTSNQLSSCFPGQSNFDLNECSRSQQHQFALFRLKTLQAHKKIKESTITTR